MKDEELKKQGWRMKSGEEEARSMSQEKDQEVWAKQEYTKTQRSRFEIKNKDQITKSQESATKSQKNQNQESRTKKY